jgi:hypothetical protein
VGVVVIVVVVATTTPAATAIEKQDFTFNRRQTWLFLGNASAS